MSRGFVKEDDQEEPPFIPPRAPLPEGVINYVTPRGLELLEQERNDLEEERKAIIESAVTGSIGDDEKRRDLAVINGKMDLLMDRIATANVIDPEPDPKEVRFGTSVTFNYKNGEKKGEQSTFTIVGVDGSDVKKGFIAFTAPIARALIGKSVGDVVAIRLGPQELELEIIKISQ